MVTLTLIEARCGDEVTARFASAGQGTELGMLEESSSRRGVAPPSLSPHGDRTRYCMLDAPWARSAVPEDRRRSEVCKFPESKRDRNNPSVVRPRAIHIPRVPRLAVNENEEDGFIMIRILPQENGSVLQCKTQDAI